MTTFKTPGVYVEEVSTFPASVVRVATAVPVFIGYTETDENHLIPTKVRSLVEYERLYGGEPASGGGRSLNVTLSATDYSIQGVKVGLSYYLYHSLRLFFANGGGDAYIQSIGSYSNTGPAVGDYDDEVFTELSKVDEVTLLLAPDAWGLSATGLGQVHVKMLEHCDKMQDRFAILDVAHDSGYSGPLSSSRHDSADFRDEVGTRYLKYGAAYYPELRSILGPKGEIGLSDFTMKDENSTVITLADLGNGIHDKAIEGYFAAIDDRDIHLLSRTALEALATTFPDPGVTDETDLKDQLLKIKFLVDAIFGKLAAPLSNDLVQELVTRLAAGASSPLGLIAAKLFEYDDGFKHVLPGPPLGAVAANAYSSEYGTFPLTNPTPTIYVPSNLSASISSSADDYQALFDEVYDLYDRLITFAEQIATGEDLFTTSRKLAEIRDAIRNTGYTLPPCGAVAGVYAVNNATRGVWHAPANMSLNAVREVARKIQASDLDDLNIPDAGNGKSINAIRFFKGQGNLVYGARTLAGNDNEWRYVPVRRLYIMVEESVRKATEPFVFEPNNANTWQKAKGMIESFLYGLWRDGALAGAAPKDAFFVKVGLGQTMTAQDILEGRMIIEIGMAAVRPAEFVIVRFSHKMQES